MSHKKKEFKWLPEQPCIVCGRMTPIPMIYCSSKCKEADEDRQLAELEELKRLERDERLERLEGKAIKRKRKGRRTNKGTFHGKSRGKHVGKDY